MSTTMSQFIIRVSPNCCTMPLAVRRQQLQQAAQQIQDIGIPIRKRSSPVSAAPAPANPQTVRKRTTPPKSRRLVQEDDVALSFAGENREYVEEVATVLRASGIKVFYDKFLETWYSSGGVIFQTIWVKYTERNRGSS